MLDQITPLILTYNEAPNLERTMRQLSWAKDIVVVDSFSDDETTMIASSLPQTRICQRTFDSHRAQWSFGLTETGIKTPWVLALDADYVLTDEFVSELQSLNPEPGVNGFRANFVYCLNGKSLRSGIYPSVAVLYRSVCRVQDGTRIECRLTVKFANSVQNSSRRSQTAATLAGFTGRLTDLEAKKLLASTPETVSRSDRVRRWQIIAPGAVLFYCHHPAVVCWTAGLGCSMRFSVVGGIDVVVVLIEARLTRHGRQWNEVNPT